MFLSLILTTLVLSLIILVHELGHALVARAVGEQVEVFSLGFGKVLYTFKVGNTLCNLCLIPIGGYVKIPGLERKPRLRAHTAILLAGPIANFLLGFLFVTVSGFMGEERSVSIDMIGDVEVHRVVIVEAEANSGLLPGDRLVRINGILQQNAEYAAMTLAGIPKDTNLTFEVLRGETPVFVTQPIQSLKLPLENIGVVHRDLVDSFAATCVLTLRIGEAVVHAITHSDLKDFSGPIGMGQTMHTERKQPIDVQLIMFGAASISIGLMNLLPIPPLDGGKLLILFIRRINVRVGRIVENFIAKITVPLILVFMLFVTARDILNLF